MSKFSQKKIMNGNSNSYKFDDDATQFYLISSLTLLHGYLQHFIQLPEVQKTRGNEHNKNNHKKRICNGKTKIKTKIEKIIYKSFI